jgi:hypothetical protein
MGTSVLGEANIGENLKRIRKILAVMVIVSILSLVASPVLAVSDVTGLKVIPTDTTMSLLWVKGSTYTVIRYSTTSYPATPAAGTNVFAVAYIAGNSYVQTEDSVTHLPLVAGTTYYYTAWAYDGANYSPDVSAAHAIMTTTASAGTSDVLTTPPYVTPTAPSSSGWFTGLQPFSGFVQGFEQSWGMATDTMPFTIGILILLVAGIGVYLKTKSAFVAIVADFAVDLGLIGLGLLSPYTIGVVLAFGLGVWALENIWI